MSGMDIWMRANPMAYIWLGSYAVAFLVFAIEMLLLRQRRKETLKQIKMMRDVGEDE